jgi:hypothetical protein
MSVPPASLHPINETELYSACDDGSIADGTQFFSDRQIVRLRRAVHGQVSPLYTHAIRCNIVLL